jgi:CDP-4-dehydro-6-deoxyglucose reductase
MRQLELDLPSFRYYPVLSREQWEGRNGYVHPVYEELSQTAENAQYMLCGWREMLDEGKRRLLEKGVPSKDIHIEIYG